MKLSPVMVLCTLLSAASFSIAQNAVIGSPTRGTSVPAGSTLTVRIDRPDSLSGSEEVAIVMGLWSCGTNPCPGPANIMGNILYNGPFNPQFSAPSDSLPPHEFFNISIPDTIAKGPAQLGVAHMALIGAGLAPFLETLNATVNIV